MRRPDFFIVGAPRCGTTFMYTFLRMHPDVFMPDLKEPDFFCPDLDSGSDRDSQLFTRDLAAYLSLFAEARAESRVGEASSGYLFSDVAAQRIKQFDARAAIIIQLREPVEEMYSYHNIRFVFGGEDVGFERALELESERREGRHLPGDGRNAKMSIYRAVASYVPQVARYLEVFARDQVHITIYEDLQADPAGTYRATLNFLGLDSSFSPPTRIVNAGMRPRFKPLFRILHSRSTSRGARRVIPARWHHAAGSLVSKAQRITRREDPRPALDPTLRAELELSFHSEVEELSELLGMDLVARWYGSRPLKPTHEAAEVVVADS
ncbi:MAG: sulfotransferase domain-containing protein [Gemmatimonadetes bacterium]|nr:sulfotransferase domain-containing protein [Gemmatimonadota bacterium]